MKKCPYCAEQIQDEAIVCRYCSRRLKMSRRQKAILFIAVTFIESSMIIYKDEVKAAAVGAGEFVREVKYVCWLMKDVIRDLPMGVQALKNYKKLTAEFTAKMQQFQTEDD